jgi:hypothetical protein
MVPRTKGMRAFSPTKHLREQWNVVRAARTTASLLRRLNAFTAAVTQHLRAEQPFIGEPGRMFAGRPTLVFNDDGTISKRFSGPQGTPAVTFRTLYGRYGHFAYSFFRGVFEIAIDIQKKRPEYATVLDGVRATFLHELQHFIDSEISLSDEKHGRRFQKRLSVLESMFPEGADGQDEALSRKQPTRFRTRMTDTQPQRRVGQRVQYA